MKKVTGIALLLVMFNVATAAKANAGWFQSSAQAGSNTDNGSSSLFLGEGIFRTIQGLTIDTNNPAIQASTVTSVTNPAASTAKSKVPPKTYVVSASGYNAVRGQTDASPCRAASGLNICTTDLNIVAANICDSHGNNIIPLHTAIKIPSLYGDTIFFVEDRMNKRYCNNIDVLLPDYASAMNLGRRIVRIEIVS